ncbi:unnamed protein product [Amoebophrya sp. A120]|nr:unnamed protein product [Amoebophrya sp. A120]|eukprot:GSA120T00004713001.1
MADAIFAQIQKAVETDGEKLVKSAKAVFCFKIKEGNTWLVDLKNGKGSVTKGEGKADCTITIGDADLVINCKYVWVWESRTCHACLAFLENLCCVSSRRAAAFCHAKTQFVMRARHQRAFQKLVMLGCHCKHSNQQQISITGFQTATYLNCILVAMAAGKLNGMQAFMQGKMKIAGNMGLAQKLQGIFASLKK